MPTRIFIFSKNLLTRSESKLRTFIAVIIAMLVIVVGWLFVYNSIDKHTLIFIESLDNISDTIKEANWNLVAFEFSKIRNNWTKIRKPLSILLDHHEIDNIDLSMAKADQYIYTKNLPLSLGEIEVLRQLFTIVKESESLMLTNIF